MNHVEAEGKSEPTAICITYVLCNIQHGSRVCCGVSFECLPTALFLHEEMEHDNKRDERE